MSESKKEKLSKQIITSGLTTQKMRYIIAVYQNALTKRVTFRRKAKRAGDGERPVRVGKSENHF